MKGIQSVLGWAKPGEYKREPHVTQARHINTYPMPCSFLDLTCGHSLTQTSKEQVCLRQPERSTVLPLSWLQREAQTDG